MKTVIFEGIYETTEKQSSRYEKRFEWEEDSNSEDVRVAYVKLDGKIYRFEEDPSDGYRSYCETTIVTKAPEGAFFNFEYHPVLVSMLELDGEDFGNPDEYSPFSGKDFRGIVLISPKDKQTVLAVFGTDNIGDYYPGCRMYMDIPSINKHCIPNTEAGKVIYASEE